MIQITIEEKDKKPRDFKVEKFPVSIGRTKDNDIRIPTPYFSREHCRIEKTEKGFKIVDLDSKNGLEVNDQTVKSSSLVSGDIITIGNTRFRFMDTEAGESEKEEPRDKPVEPAKSTSPTLDLQKNTFNSEAWKEQLETEKVAECRHCGTYFTKTGAVPGAGLFCPKCKTTLSEYPNLKNQTNSNI